MKRLDLSYFELLKKKIVETIQQSYPGMPGSMSDWKGQDIINFQEELRNRQQEQISVKWFYTHMKSGSKKLPRVDILNFLSKYVGYKNWSDFVHLHAGKVITIQKKRPNRMFYVIPLFTISVLTVFLMVYSAFKTREYSFCFYDNDTKQQIRDSSIEIRVLSEHESPVSYFCSPDGCFTIRTGKKTIRFAVNPPYYKPDTITRRLIWSNHAEQIKLVTDDYALMLHYFSMKDVEGWEERREQLNRIFSDDVKIFQILRGTVGMEMYNKREFIDKLTFPVNSLKNIEILDVQYENEKIIKLRFKQTEP